MTEFDLAASQNLFDLGQGLPYELVVFLATYLFWLMIGGLLFYCLLAHRKKFARNFFLALLAALLGKAVNAIIGFFYWRPRPFVSLVFQPLIDKSSLDKSFPSDHAAMAWAVAIFVWLHNKKVGFFFILAAFLISISRVLAGVHFVSDIAAGSLIGLIIGALVWKIRILLYKKTGAGGGRPKE